MANRSHLQTVVCAFERRYIINALQRYNSCVRLTAQKLGMPERTLWNRMSLLGVKRPTAQDDAHAHNITQ